MKKPEFKVLKSAKEVVSRSEDYSSECEIRVLHGDLVEICQAIVDAEKAMEHVVESTSGYTGGLPQEWLETYQKETK